MRHDNLAIKTVRFQAFNTMPERVSYVEETSETGEKNYGERTDYPIAKDYKTTVRNYWRPALLYIEEASISVSGGGTSDSMTAQPKEGQTRGVNHQFELVRPHSVSAATSFEEEKFGSQFRVLSAGITITHRVRAPKSMQGRNLWTLAESYLQITAGVSAYSGAIPGLFEGLATSWPGEDTELAQWDIAGYCEIDLSGTGVDGISLPLYFRRGDADSARITSVSMKVGYAPWIYEN